MFLKKIYSFMYSYYSYWMLFLLKKWEKIKHFISFSTPPYCIKSLQICLENGFSHSIPSIFHVSRRKDIRTSPVKSKKKSSPSKVFSFFNSRFHTYSSFFLFFLDLFLLEVCNNYCCCSLFLNHFAWTLDSWIIYKINFYELGMNNLYDSINALKIWKLILSHTSCIIQIV